MSESNIQKKNVYSIQEHSGVNDSASVVQSANETAMLNYHISPLEVASHYLRLLQLPSHVIRPIILLLPQPSTSNAKTFYGKCVTKQKKKNVPSQNNSV